MAVNAVAVVADNDQRMADNDAAAPDPLPRLRIVHDSGGAVGERALRPPRPSAQHDPTPSGADAEARLTERLRSVEARTQALTERIERVQGDLRLVHAALVNAEWAAPSSRRRWALPAAWRAALPDDAALVRDGVLALLAGLLALAVWAGTVDYALRVTSDTPTFLALLSDMAKRPFAEQSPFLAHSVATQHATPYIQALAFVWRFLDPGPHSAMELGRFLALAGIVVFALTLGCVFLYVRRLAGSTAAWLSLPVLLGLFGPPHVIWASDLSLHAALYAGFFPQNFAIGLALSTLLALERRSRASLVAACGLASLTMLVHPFTGVLLCVLATAESCRRAVKGDSSFRRGPIALGVGFAAGMMWPAYSLDRAFAETGLRGVVFVGLSVAAPFLAPRLATVAGPSGIAAAASRLASQLERPRTVSVLALIGAAGTVAIACWELALVHAPPATSARLAIYWVDERWRWPLLLVAGTVGLSGLARLARRGHIVPAVWFTGCFALGTLGALGAPLPVWYRFLLLCQIPLAVGVVTVLVETPRSRTTAIVAATFALALGVKVLTLVATPPEVSYFGRQLQPVWALGEHIPPGTGLVATDPATAYFIPAVTGRHVLTVGRGHVSSRQELAYAEDGYQLLRRYYLGGSDWWQAGQEMWRRGVRYVVVEKQTTLDPPNLSAFIWQTAILRTPAQRQALGNYFYENNKVGTVVYDSPDYAVYRFDERKLFPDAATTGTG
jgi:hypothetical protein